MALADQFQGRAERESREADVVLGEDWLAPGSAMDDATRARRARRSSFSLRHSPLTRKIVTFNLLALNILAAGILYLNASDETLIYRRAAVLASEAALVADLVEAGLDETASAPDPGTLAGLHLKEGISALLYDSSGALLSERSGTLRPQDFGVPAQAARERPTPVLDTLQAVTRLFSWPLSEPAAPLPPLSAQIAPEIETALSGKRSIEINAQTSSGRHLVAAVPITGSAGTVGALAISGAAGDVERAVRQERERVLQMFLVAMLVSVGLSLVLASTISNPISDLAKAAEAGRDRDAGAFGPGRVHIPDLTGRPDEIGRLSGALRGMVAALYDRIDSNEQFAADVAHEIKNPLASLRSAVGTLRLVKRDDQREKLLNVIEHDVRRLDRLVSDISNASRLDSELVKEEEESFDLVEMVTNLTEYLGQQAREDGIEFITDMPATAVEIRGLEARLAQVFVNLITNAISFCEDGDAIRVWVRRRENRVLVVVEDTGPGIPDEALKKIFKRFYSSRPATDFGNNSGLGLAISKQIVEAHGGVIWAENIRPTEADPTSEPLGARFVVGLPV